MVTDTRPYERIQHSFNHYGRFILEYYGKEAFTHWLLQKYRIYHAETRGCLIDFDEEGNIVPSQK